MSPGGDVRGEVARIVGQTRRHETRLCAARLARSAPRSSTRLDCDLADESQVALVKMIVKPAAENSIERIGVACLAWHDESGGVELRQSV